MRGNKAKRIIPTLVGIGITAGLIAFLLSGGNAEVIASVFSGEVSDGDLAELGSALGARGKITVAALSAVQVIFAFLPAEPAQMLGGVLYGFGGGVLLSFLGVLVGNTVIYLLYGILGEKLRDHFGKSAGIDVSGIKSRRVFAVITLVMYILPAIPYGLICFFAVSFGMKYPEYIGITMLGSMPSILIGVLLGQLAVRSSIVVSCAVFLWIVVGMVMIYAKRKAIFDYINRRINGRKGE